MLLRYFKQPSGTHLHSRFCHTPNDRLSTIVHMNVLDTDKLLPAATLALQKPSLDEPLLIRRPQLAALM
jgi:hypothetical protein